MYARAFVEELNHNDRLVYEWRRAERFWTPLSVIAVDAARLPAWLSGREVGRWLVRSCREVDVPCRTGAATYCVILPGTNRTGAEAELTRLGEIARELDPDGDRLGLAVAVAFDDARTPLELKIVAERAARAHSFRSATPQPLAGVPSVSPSERPTLPQLESSTWIEHVALP